MTESVKEMDKGMNYLLLHIYTYHRFKVTYLCCSKTARVCGA